MGSEIPKQYLPLAGRPVLVWSLDALLGHPRITGAVLALRVDDTAWPRVDYRANKPLWLVPGASERCASVASALDQLAHHAALEDWVLVHDAVRPCISMIELNALIDTCWDHPVGGVLAIPVQDTLKRVAVDHRIEATVDRGALWQAQTPQMFRLGVLRDALHAALDKNMQVTDEASAMEHVGHYPCVVVGSVENMKITRPDDLDLAAYYLARRAAARDGSR